MSCRDTDQDPDRDVQYGEDMFPVYLHETIEKRHTTERGMENFNSNISSKDKLKTKNMFIEKFESQKIPELNCNIPNKNDYNLNMELDINQMIGNNVYLYKLNESNLNLNQIISKCKGIKLIIDLNRIFKSITNLNKVVVKFLIILNILLMLNKLIIAELKVNCNAFLIIDPVQFNDDDHDLSSSSNKKLMYSPNFNGSKNLSGLSGNGYLDKLDNLERSVAAVLIKVAYGTTSTTKRSIPDSFLPSLSTIATPPLTTLRYQEKLSHRQQINLHHRNYELDLERDHALPTSAPNADILKSNSNPTYPNPNRHHNYGSLGTSDQRHRHLLNSPPSSTAHNNNLSKKLQNSHTTIPMYDQDHIPSYSPPLRSFFTPPLPPEYQNPFADKPTLRGTNNDLGLVVGQSPAVSTISQISNMPAGTTLNGNNGVLTNSYINRRPIPPPSLMPGHERVPLRPPDLQSTTNSSRLSVSPKNLLTTELQNNKKLLNSPSINMKLDEGRSENPELSGVNQNSQHNFENNEKNSRTLTPNLTRILTGSHSSHNPISDTIIKQQLKNRELQQIQENQQSSDRRDDVSQKNPANNENNQNGQAADNKLSIKVSPASSATIFSGQLSTENSINKNIDLNSNNSAQSTSQQSDLSKENSLQSNNNGRKPAIAQPPATNSINLNVKSRPNSSASPQSTQTWDIAWNLHIYISVILFTVLAVYTIFKIIIYNKLTHLFNQSYFVIINLILLLICCLRIFFLIYDAYNINLSFSLLFAELLLNLPDTFLTTTFSCLILFLLVKSINCKNNRYSTLIRPLAIVVGCGVHIGLCITLYIVENYTIEQHYLKHGYWNQQQQIQLLKQHQQQFYAPGNSTLGITVNPASIYPGTGNSQQFVILPPPPKVLSLIYKVIYILICCILGILYLYLYHIIKKILLNKSKNYIHGYQNLSNAIHITIAISLLFILLGIIQIFGIISIITQQRGKFAQSSDQKMKFVNSTLKGALKQQNSPQSLETLLASYKQQELNLNYSSQFVNLEIDWLQWGYQFSLRLIEITIIWLISWVTSLKIGGNINTGQNGTGTASGVNLREKSNYHSNNHYDITQIQTSVAGGNGFSTLFPCASMQSSASSQIHNYNDSLDVDYPIICNANTNLHSYTLRTGKKIYNDDDLTPQTHLNENNFELNAINQSLSETFVNNIAMGGIPDQEYPLKSHETHSIHSSCRRIPGGDMLALEPNLKSSFIPNQEFDRDSNVVTDLDDDDHYENPDFELSTTNKRMAPQQLLNNANNLDNCYTEPLNAINPNMNSQNSKTLNYSGLNSTAQYSDDHRQNCNYDIQKFERPYFSPKAEMPQIIAGQQQSLGSSSASLLSNTKVPKDSKMSKTKSAKYNFDRMYDISDRQNLNSMDRHHGYFQPQNPHYNTHYHTGAPQNYNSFDHKPASFNNNANVRKQASIGGNNQVRGIHCHTNSSVTSSSSSSISSNVHQTNCDNGSNFGTQTLNCNRQSSGHSSCGSGKIGKQTQFPKTTLDRNPKNGIVSDLIPSSCGASCDVDGTGNYDIALDKNSGMKLTQRRKLMKNFISMENNFDSNKYATNGRLGDISLGQNQELLECSTNSDLKTSANNPQQMHHQNGDNSMLVADHGFVRFRPLDDINNAQGVGIHNASLRLNVSNGQFSTANSISSQRKVKDKRYSTNNS